MTTYIYYKKKKKKKKKSRQCRLQFGSVKLCINSHDRHRPQQAWQWSNLVPSDKSDLYWVHHIHATAGRLQCTLALFCEICKPTNGKAHDMTRELLRNIAGSDKLNAPFHLCPCLLKIASDYNQSQLYRYSTQIKPYRFVRPAGDGWQHTQWHKQPINQTFTSLVDSALFI
jgi:hypothetical protein